MHAELSLELILGIIGTAGSAATAITTFYVFYYNRPKLRIEGKHCNHWTWRYDQQSFTAFRAILRVHNKGPVGTRLTKAELEFNADRHYEIVLPYVEKRIESSDSEPVELEFLQGGIQIRDATVNCRVKLHHTYGEIPFHIVSEFSEQPVQGVGAI